MAKQKRKPTPNQQAYKKQVNRIKRAYRELQKQGYRFTEPIENILPEKPKRITSKELLKLQKITRTALRAKATAISPKTGKIVSGTQAAKEARSEAAKRGWKKRKLPKPTPKPVDYGLEPITRTHPYSTPMLPDEGDIILQNIEDLISQAPSKKGAQYLRDLLSHDIAKYGRKAVAHSLANAPEDMVALAQEIIFYEDQYLDINGNDLTNVLTSRNIRHFADLIRGSLPTEEDLKQFDDYMSGN